MIEDITGDWFNDAYKARHDDFDLLLRNLRYMLYRYKNEEQIKARTINLIVKTEAEYGLFLSDNALKIRERDILFLGGLEKPNEQQPSTPTNAAEFTQNRAESQTPGVSKAPEDSQKLW